MSTDEFEATFAQFRSILEEFEPRLVKVRDEPGVYYLDSEHIMPNRKPLFFGSANIGKRYVSFHLMPVYVWPELLDGMSEGLRKRMQGKSCFNFRKPDPELFQELRALTRKGFERYREHGYVG